MKGDITMSRTTSKLNHTTNFSKLYEVINNKDLEKEQPNFIPTDYMAVFYSASVNPRVKTRKDGTQTDEKIFYLSTSNKELIAHGATEDFLAALNHLYITYGRFVRRGNKQSIQNWNKEVVAFLGKYFLAETTDATPHELMSVVRSTGLSKNRLNKDKEFVQGTVSVIPESTFRTYMFNWIAQMTYDKDVSVSYNDKYADKF